MAYAFNENKSKAPVYTKAEQASMIKTVSVTGQIYDNGVNGRCYLSTATVLVPTGYTPIGVTVVSSANVPCSLQKSGNTWFVNAMTISSGAAKIVDFTGKVYCVKNEFITT